jgi:hypothetical protein
MSVAGLVPAIHAFPAADRALFEDVGGRNESGHGGSKVVPVSSAPSYSCSKTRNRTAAAQGRPRRNWRGDFTSFVAARFAPEHSRQCCGRHLIVGLFRTASPSLGSSRRAFLIWGGTFPEFPGNISRAWAGTESRYSRRCRRGILRSACVNRPWEQCRCDFA